MEAGFPDMVKVTNVKTTYEGRQIKLVHVSLDLAETSKQPAIFIDCGIHAREWVSPAFCLYTLDRLVDEGKISLFFDSFLLGLSSIRSMDILCPLTMPKSKAVKGVSTI